MQSLTILLSACGFSYLLNMILLRFSSNFGIRSRQNQGLIRWATAAKPTTGGISFYITFLLSAIIMLALRSGPSEIDTSFLGLLTAGSLAFLIGFADDAYSTNPTLKFLGQVLCGVVLIAFDVQIHFFDIYILDSLLTIFWVVGLMNSLNMLDNMDGVTTTITLTILAVSLSMMALGQQGFSGLYFILIALVGSFCGFLFWNWQPARIYMGDTGSMFIGLLLAFVGIKFFWNIETSPDNISHLRKGLIPLLVFLVPIMDTSFVTISRLSRGQSPFVGGRDHLTHHLVHLGIHDSLIPVALGTLSVISGCLALIAYRLIPEWLHLYSIMFLCYVIAVIAIFFFLYKKGERLGKMKDLMAEREKLNETRNIEN